MTRSLRYFLTMAAAALLLVLCSSAVLAQGKPNKPQPPQTSQKQGDTDRDRDRDRDADRDQDRDQDMDRDRDRTGAPMNAQDKAAMMRQMRQDRNHLMADGFRRNMLNFAQNLRFQLERGEGIDRDFAKGAVREIKRNFQELEKRHKAHKREMSVRMREQMSNMIREMEEYHNRIRNTLRVLENDADARAPDARQMLMHVRELEEQLRLMEQDRDRNYTGAVTTPKAPVAFVDIAVLNSP